VPSLSLTGFVKNSAGAVVSQASAGVLRGRMILPQQGVWHADLVIDASDVTTFAAGNQVMLASLEGDFSLAGTIRRVGEWMDTMRLRVVGGAGGLYKNATTKQYVGATVRILLLDLMAAAGEQLSSSTDAALLAILLAQWIQLAQPVAHALGNLIKRAAPAYNWRVLGDGTVWLGPDTFPAVTNWDYLVDQFRPADGAYVLAVDRPLLLPAQSLPEIGNVGDVEYVIDDHQLRCHLWLSDDAAAASLAISGSRS
jgi:hypothetical protein